jgi:hypothetical protein
MLSRTAAIWVAIASSMLSGSAHADSADAAKQRAASAFDQGVAAFEDARYAEAARAFLVADAEVPNSEALKNALAAALRSEDPLCIARAAERVLGRADIAPALGATARDARDAALKRIAVLDVRCAPEPCSIELDGAAVAAGTTYASAGAHTLVAQGAGGARDEKEVSCGAAETCHAELRLQPAVVPAPANTVVAQVGAHAQPSSPPPPPGKRDASSGSARPLPLSAFVLGCVGTGALTGLVIWSGVDALSVHDEQERLSKRDPSAYEPDKAHDAARRTDYLLAGALVLGAVTAASGIWLVDWRSSPQPEVALTRGGMRVSARASF